MESGASAGRAVLEAETKAGTEAADRDVVLDCTPLPSSVAAIELRALIGRISGLLAAEIVDEILGRWWSPTAWNGLGEFTRGSEGLACKGADNDVDVAELIIADVSVDGERRW